MKTQNPWMGRAKGSAGNMTASKVYDKNVLKAKAFEVNNPNTAAQQNQRTFFKQVSELINTLSEADCRLLCPKAPKGMSRKNYLIKQLARKNTTEDGQKMIDFLTLKSLGNARTADIMEAFISVDEEENKIDVVWFEGAKYVQEHQNDAVILLIINETKSIMKLSYDNKTFSDGKTSFKIQPNMSVNDSYLPIIFNGGIDEGVSTMYDLTIKERPMDD